MMPALLLAGLVLVGPAQRPLPQSPNERVAERIRTRLEVPAPGADARIHEPRLLAVFYGRRALRPAWSDEHGPNRLADDLVDALRRADLDGLRPHDYHLSAVVALLAAVRADAAGGHLTDPDRAAELDLLLTDAFLTYGSHLLAGRVDPETLHPRWSASPRGGDLAAVLAKALDERDLARTLQRLAPTHEGYVRLRAALARARAIAAAGGWPEVPDGPVLRRGDRDPRVAVLRARLHLGGDLESGEADEAALFDERLDAALRRFQRRHGLEPDGLLTATSRAELNVGAVARLRQLELNLERWRWLPKTLGRRRLVVNIAAYELEAIEDEEIVLAMRVVVGRRYRRTPVFSDTVRYIVLNPYWHVPRTIAAYDLLPKIQRDTAFFSRYRMSVFDSWDADAREIDPRTVDWSAVDPESFRYRLQQDPGRYNALGRVKFMFPNRHDVYLHDTPQRELFEETRRDFSSGCIRVERPLELAAWLLRKTRDWDRDALGRALAAAGERTIPLHQPVPIHLLYWTAWAEPDGTIHFRPDIHNLDPPLAAALQQGRASTGEGD